MTAGVGHTPTYISQGVLAATNHIRDQIDDTQKLFLWSNVDTGANVNIVNNSLFISNFTPTPQKELRVADGRCVPVEGKGDWIIRLGNDIHILQNTLCMPENPNCTLSTGFLKRYHGFTYAPHDAFDSFTLKHSNGTKIRFTPESRTMKTRNGIDYVAIHTIPPPRNESSQQQSSKVPVHLWCKTLLSDIQHTLDVDGATTQKQVLHMKNGLE